MSLSFRSHSIVQHGEDELLAMYHERGVQSLPALKGEPLVRVERTRKGNPVVFSRAYDRRSIFDQILAYEQGELDFNETLALFQDLVDTGLAWELQGSFGRMAASFLRDDLIEARTPIARRVKEG